MSLSLPTRCTSSLTSLSHVQLVRTPDESRPSPVAYGIVRTPEVESPHHLEVSPLRSRCRFPLTFTQLALQRRDDRTGVGCKRPHIVEDILASGARWDTSRDSFDQVRLSILVLFSSLFRVSPRRIDLAPVTSVKIGCGIIYLLGAQEVTLHLLRTSVWTRVGLRLAG